MKMKLWALSLAAVLVFALSACSAREATYAYDTSVMAPGEDPGGSANIHSEMNEDAAWAGESQTGGEGSQEAPERVIIQNAELQIEAEDAAALYAKLAALARELGGHEFGFNITHHETYSVVEATLRIPPEKLNDFMGFSFEGENSRVINSKMSSEDVTESFFDAQTRLETKKATLQRYYALLEAAESLSDILSLQKTINDVTEDIEALEGRLKMWRSLAELATVKVLIRQQNDPVTIQKEIDWSMLSLEDMGFLIQRGLTAILSGIVTVLQVAALVLIVGSPLWVPGLIVLVFILRYLKKRRAKNLLPQSPPEEQPPEDENM